MLNEIGSVAKVPEFIKQVKSGEGSNRLMGFGHRVYKSYDPRAKVIKRIADLVFTVTGKNPLLEIALELERIALQDDYFVTRKLYPNVDFYSGLIYQAMGFPVEMFPVLFAIPRTAGWIAQWEEMLLDPEQKIARPRQIYTGPATARLRAAGEAGVNRRSSTLTLRRGLCGHGCRPSALPQAARAPKFDSSRAWEHLRQLVAIGPRPAGSPAIEQTRKYIKEQLARRRRSTVTEQAWDDQTPLGTVHMVNLIATIPGARKERIVIAGHYDTKLYPRVPLRRRQRRRVERGVPDRAGARAEGAAERADDRAAVPRRRGSAASSGSGTDNTYGSRHYVEAAQARRLARDAQGDRPRRHDRRPRSAHPARHQLDAVADRHHLGRRRSG